MKIQLTILAICWGILLSASATGQSRPEFSLPDLQSLRQGGRISGQSQVEARGLVPLDAPLDPAEYMVGPGDLIAVNTWSSAPTEHQLTVTPEGYLLIPAVGSIQVRGLTLEGVRSAVLPQVQKKFPGALSTLTLVAPRKVSVRVSGQVLNEGVLEISAAQRVDHLISLANALSPTQMTREFYESDLPRLRRNASERNIIIRHSDGSTRPVDLLKYRITGEGRYNPYLREGDMVYVPARKLEDNNIGVLSGVIGPTSVEYADGDRITDLIKMGFGLKSQASPSEALLARESESGGMDTVRVNVRAILEKVESDIPLRPGDRLLIPETQELRVGEYVTVEGAVQRPGRYPIVANRTSLRDLIRFCGGFAPGANIVGSALSRMPLEEIGSVLRSSQISTQDSAYYAQETLFRLQGEMVSVDFRGLFIRGDTALDVTLRNRDRLLVPARQHSVYVFGQVGQPGHVPHIAGMGYKHYVERAGGFTDLAETGDVKVIKAGSRVWLDPDETQVEDGDMIWVPKEVSYPFAYYLTSATQIAGIIGTVATLFILAQTLK